MLRYMAAAWLAALLMLGSYQAVYGRYTSGSSSRTEFTLLIIATALVDVMFTLRRIEKQRAAKLPEGI
jgi:hypothetical protein